MSNIHPGSSVAKTAVVDASARVWDMAQLREHCVIERDCIVGAGAYIGVSVTLGAGTKVQNYALVYEPAIIGKGVFIGPAAILTNDHNPRAVNLDGSLKGAEDWSPVGVIVEDGASIGARAVCVAPVRIGKWALVGAGSVVTNDVPDFALVVGNPARQVGWVGRRGFRLVEAGDGLFVCPKSGEAYSWDSELNVLTLVTAS